MFSCQDLVQVCSCFAWARSSLSSISWWHVFWVLQMFLNWARSLKLHGFRTGPDDLDLFDGHVGVKINESSLGQFWSSIIQGAVALLVCRYFWKLRISVIVSHARVYQTISYLHFLGTWIPAISEHFSFYNQRLHAHAHWQFALRVTQMSIYFPCAALGLAAPALTGVVLCCQDSADLEHGHAGVVWAGSVRGAAGGRGWEQSAPQQGPSRGGALPQLCECVVLAVLRVRWLTSSAFKTLMAIPVHACVGRFQPLWSLSEGCAICSGGQGTGCREVTLDL